MRRTLKKLKNHKGVCMEVVLIKKFIHLFKLWKNYPKGHELYALDNALCEELNINSRTLRRYLDELHIYFSMS